MNEEQARIELARLVRSDFFEDIQDCADAILFFPVAIDEGDTPRMALAKATGLIGQDGKIQPRKSKDALHTLPDDFETGDW